MNSLQDRRRRLRIGVYHDLPSGGAKRALWYQIKGLASYHDVDLFTCTSMQHNGLDVDCFTRSVQRFPWSSGLVAQTSFWRFLNPLTFIFRLPLLEQHYRSIAEQMNSGGYDVAFVTHGLVTTPYLLKYLHVPNVYYCQEPYRQAYEKLPVHRDVGFAGFKQWVKDSLRIDKRILHTLLKQKDRKTVLHASLVLCNSHFSRQRIRQAYGVETQVNYLGVDADKFRPLGMWHDNFVLSVGEVHPRKGFDLILEALATLPVKQRPELRIVCFQWDRREKAYLESLAQRLGISLSFLSHISDQSLVELYNQAAITVFTPVREPFGFVPLEAMACESPVIGVKEGGLRETIVDEVTGILVDRDAVALGQAISRLLRDRALAECLGKNGRQDVLRRWTWDKSIHALEQFLTQVCVEE